MKCFFSQNDFEISQREILFEGFFTVIRFHLRYRLFKGGWNKGLTREIMERSPAVAILPYDPRLDRVILIEQFRQGALADPVSPWQFEIPAGLIDCNETPEQVAIREAKEEAGCTLSNIRLLYDFFVSPGASNEYLHIFYGEVDSKGAEGIFGLEAENEDIRVINLSREEAFEVLHQGQIKSMPAIVALQWLELNYKSLRKTS